MRTQLLILVALSALSLAQTAFSGPVHETFVVPEIPNQGDVDSWAALPGERTFLIQTQDPGAADLAPLASLRGYDRLEIENTMYPTPDTVQAWSALAARGAEFIAIGAGVPLPAEIDLLNQIGFGSCVLVLDYYPGVDEAQRLRTLSCLKSISFASDRYPKYEEKDGLLALPSGVQLLFATDYWPYFAHMDLFNMIPQPINLRVSDMVPPDDEWDYLQHIQRLGKIEVQASFEPTSETWKKFGQAHVGWLTKEYVPTAAGLEAFAESGGERSLTIDQDRPFNDDEQATLDAARIPIEWIHAAGSATPRLTRHTRPY